MRIDPANVMAHPSRRAILEAIHRQPGVYLHELIRFGVTESGVRWHVGKLRRMGLVRLETDATGTRAYATATPSSTRMRARQA